MRLNRYDDVLKAMKIFDDIKDEIQADAGSEDEYFTLCEVNSNLYKLVSGYLRDSMKRTS